MAIISIIGIIGDEYKYSDFITAFASAPDELINLEINSLGGDVEDGEKIADFISRNESRFNRVSNSGNVASIAATIFLSLPREKRFFDVGKGFFLIHNPFLDPASLAYFNTTADGLSAISEELKVIEDRLAKNIAKQTNASLEIVKEFMKIDEQLTIEQMNALNIATITQYKAVAFYNKQTNKMTQEQIDKLISEKNEGFFANVKSWIRKAMNFKAMTITLADGKLLDFPDIAEGGEPTVGDTATIDGAPATGEILLANGGTYVFENGALTEIKEAVSDEPADDIEALKAENEKLKADLEAATAKAKADLEAIKAEMRTIKSKMAVTNPTPAPAPTPSNSVRSLSEILK